MRSRDVQQLGVFSYVSVEERIPQNHPIRNLRRMVDLVLKELDQTLDSRYSPIGRPSIPPERLLRALVLQVVYSVRSERQLMEQVDYNLAFRWFIGLNVDDPVWDHSTFSFNRERLFDAEIAQRFFEHTVLLAEITGLASDEHFSVDGTLLKAWASQKSFRCKDGKDDGDGSDFRRSERRNDTHGSTTDPDARLMRKGQGKEAKLSYQASVLMEHRNGLIVSVDVRRATGTAERDAALEMLDRRDTIKDGTTLAGDKGYDTTAFVEGLEKRGVKAHIARNTGGGRRSTIGADVAATDGYRKSQELRKRIEQSFGWTKTIGMLGQLPVVGIKAVRALTTFNFAMYNLIRMGGIANWWDPSPT